MKNLKRIYFDIETSMVEGRFWRIGRKIDLSPDNITKPAQIICICYKWEHEDKVHALTWDRKHQDKKMLKDFIQVANEADELVAHNGKGFDMKWVLWECLINSIPAFPTYKMVDTLSMMRTKFRAPSNRLNYLCQVLFGKEKTPHSGLQLWHDVMDNVPGALDQMVSYCKNDVLLLEELFLTIEGYFPAKTNNAVLSGYEKWCCPYCTESDVKHSKVRVTAMGSVRHQMQCNSCKRYFTISATDYNKFLERN